MSTLPKPNPHPSRRRLRDGSVFWLDLWMAIGAVLLIGVCLNFLALRHPWRWVWHEDPALALSTMSQQWLRSIKDPIRVVVFHHPEENKWDLDSYQKIGSFSTIEEFWSMKFNENYFHLGMFFLMREDITPIWEDSSNINKAKGIYVKMGIPDLIFQQE